MGRAGGGGARTPYLRGLFAQRGKGWEGRREGNCRGGWDFAGASLPAAAPSSCRAPANGQWGGRCAGSGRCAEPPLECAERGCRRAGGEERTPRRRGTARRGSSPPRAPGPAVGLPPCFILSFNLFFPHLYFDPLGFFFPPFPAEPPPAPVPSLSSQFGFFLFFFLYITVLIVCCWFFLFCFVWFFFKAVDRERARETERAGGKRSVRPLRHHHPDLRRGVGPSGGGISPFPPGRRPRLGESPEAAAAKRGRRKRDALKLSAQTLA